MPERSGGGSAGAWARAAGRRPSPPSTAVPAVAPAPCKKRRRLIRATNDDRGWRLLATAPPVPVRPGERIIMVRERRGRRRARLERDGYKSRARPARSHRADRL